MKKIVPSLLILLLFFNCSQEDEIEQFELTTEISPSEGGTISPSKAKFDSGEKVNLTATPAEGYGFKNWSGAVSSKENPLKITIDTDKKIKATFEKSDDDGDGVADDVDQCPKTTEGQTVDARGCSDTQNDTDDDGVTDNSDECPDTPKDETVDDNGCSESQKDTDKDGISDNLDQCTETPEGETVNEEGCSESKKDSDGDGVSDHIDECLETPDGDSVDDKGCSDCQKDSDGDGVTNDIDECLGTPEGETVDKKGCMERLTTYIPDDIFEQQLIDLGYDDVIDDYVLTANISSIEILSFGTSNGFITDLTGLEAFVSLRTLNILFASDNSFSLDTANFPNLTILNLDYVRIKSLEIDGSGKLQTLVGGEGVRLDTLKAVNSSKIRRISFEKSYVGSVIISHNANLESFGTFDTNVGEILITDNVAMKFLGLSYGEIHKLDFNNNPALESFILKPLNDFDFPLDFSTYSNLKNVDVGYDGKILSINVSNNRFLERLQLENTGMKSLDVSNNNLLSILEASPNLNCIKVNQEQLDNIPSGWSKDPETSYSLDCSN